MSNASATRHDAIRAALSVARSATYLAAAGSDGEAAVKLYGWNAQVSAALMLPAHFVEVCIRNAVDEALTDTYGDRWPWSEQFARALPSRGPRDVLEATRARHDATGKVVADLTLMFWQGMFTARHDERIWKTRIAGCFPHAAGVSPIQLRDHIYRDLEKVRRLRNRIAHHEPVFAWDLDDELRRMLYLVNLRCTETAAWVDSMQGVSGLLNSEPQLISPGSYSGTC